MPIFDFRDQDGNIIVSLRAKNQIDASKAFAAMQGQGAPVTATGLAEEGGAALARGTGYLAGLGGTVADINKRIMSKAGEKGYEYVTGHKPDPRSQSELERTFAGTGAINKAYNQIPWFLGGGGSPTGQQIVETMGDLTGGRTDRPPQNVPEEYIRSIGEFLPSAAAFGGLNPYSLLETGVLPAVTSETAGQLARRYLPDRPDWMPGWVPDAETIARLGGALISPKVSSAGRKAITPNPTNKARIEASQRLDQEGVRYTAGQKTGNTTMRYREAELRGGAGVEDVMNQQAEDFTQAASKRIGLNSRHISADDMTEAESRIGNMFEGLAARNDLVPDAAMVRDLRQNWNWYANKVSKSNRSPGVRNTINDIVADAQTGRISGSRYQQYITDLRDLGDTSDGTLKKVTALLRKTLDDAMERGIAQNNPNDLGAWRVARNNWRDYNAIADTLATGARGEEGLLNPTKLNQVIANQVGKRAIVKGQSDLGQLARDGKLILQKLPQSGTAPRLAKMLNINALTKGGGVGAGIGGAIFGPPGAAIGAGIGSVAGPMISSAFGKSILSKPIQRYLGNQVLGDTPSVGIGGLLRLLEQGGELAPRAPSERHRYGGSLVD